MNFPDCNIPLIHDEFSDEYDCFSCDESFNPEEIGAQPMENPGYMPMAEAAAKTLIDMGKGK
jgi:hypothetical protein